MAWQGFISKEGRAYLEQKKSQKETCFIIVNFGFRELLTQKNTLKAT